MDRHFLSLLVDGLRSVSACMAKDNSRYAISGVLAEPSPDGLRLVTTDGYRLALARVPDLQVEGLTKPVILSAVAVKAMTGRAKSAALDIQITDAGVTVKTTAGAMQFDLIEGHFPPYREVIPGQVAPSAKVPPVNPELLESTTAWSSDRRFKLHASHQTNLGRPVLVFAPDNPHWLAVLMPIQVDEPNLWSAKDGQNFSDLTGKQMTVLESELATEAPVVAGTVGLPVRQAA